MQWKSRVTKDLIHIKQIKNPQTNKRNPHKKLKKITNKNPQKLKKITNKKSTKNKENDK